MISIKRKNGCIYVLHENGTTALGIEVIVDDDADRQTILKKAAEFCQTEMETWQPPKLRTLIRDGNTLECCGYIESTSECAAYEATIRYPITSERLTEAERASRAITQLMTRLHEGVGGAFYHMHAELVKELSQQKEKTNDT